MTPERIGRYRIVERLGAGGMGEVLKGWDDQLQRFVAVKGLPAGGEDPVLRERLRREAMTTAALTHPGIAHVYEIVSENGRDWVVMEYVQGRTLAEILAAGPLPADEAARIGEAVARALAAAHERGIVHRDVKAANVMITPDGHVKVLDFGLAKAAAGAGGPGLSSDDLTLSGAVVGTSGAMSPEQVLGGPVDARSDLFAVGSLLYEMLTGSPPFAGATPVETMALVARADHAPLDGKGSGVPHPLAAIVERCLAVDPEERFPGSADLADQLGEVARTASLATVALPAAGASLLSRLSRRHVLAAIGAAALLATAAVVYRGWIAPRPPLSVAVAPPAVHAPKGTADLLGATVYDAVSSTLQRLRGIVVVRPREVFDAGSSAAPGTGQRLAQEMGVEQVVEESVVLGDGSRTARVVISVVDGAGGRILWSRTVDVTADDLTLLHARVSEAVEDAYSDHGASSLYPPQDFTPEALRLFMSVTARVEAGTAAPPYAPEIAELERVVQLAPHFVEPMVMLASVHALLYRRSRDPEQIERCREVLREATAIAPKDPRVLRWRVKAELLAERPDAALSLARTLTGERPADGTSWEETGLALRALDRPREAEKAFLHAFSLRPTWRYLEAVGRTREEAGDPEGARAAYREALARWPETPALMADLAALDEGEGRLADAEQEVRRLVEVRGSPADLVRLGTVLIYEGRSAEAEPVLRQAVLAAPQDPAAHLWLAEALVAAGRLQEALDGFARTLAIVQASDQGPLRTLSSRMERAVCLVNLGRGPDAVMEAHAALDLAPGDPRAALTAAAVAAATGDRGACLDFTRRALTLHAAPAWFSRPEFASMRGRPEFDSLLATAAPR